MFPRNVLLFPLKISLIFLVFTEVFFFVGPIDFEIENPPLITIFLVICNIALYLGYVQGVRRSSISNYNIKLNSISIFLVIALFLKIYELSYIWSGHGIPLTLNSVLNAIFDPGKAYYSESRGFSNGSGLMRLLVAPVTWAAIPFGVFYWKQAKLYLKLLILSIIIVEIITWFGIGVRKGIFDVIIIIPMLYIAKNIIVITNKSKRRKLGLIVFGSFLLFLVYFVFSNMSRGGKDMSDFGDMLIHRTPKSSYSDNLPPWLFLSLMSIEDYLCQGYHALDKALDFGIITPVPFSSNWFSIELSKIFLSTNSLQDTYLDLLHAKVGIDPMINWHSLYVWLANTYTFLGVPFIIYIIGYYFAQSWKDAIYGRNPIAYPLLALFIIMVFYAYANNQVFSTLFTPFWFWFIFYHMTKKTLKL